MSEDQAVQQSQESEQSQESMVSMQKYLDQAADQWEKYELD